MKKGKGPYYWVLKVTCPIPPESSLKQNQLTPLSPPQAVSLMNLASANLHEKYIQNGAIENGLDIQGFLKDFTPPKQIKSPTFFGILSSVLLLGGGSTSSGGIPFPGNKISPWGGIISIAGSAFGLADKYGPAEEDVPDCEYLFPYLSLPTFMNR